MSMSQRVLVLVKPTTDAKCGVRLEGPGAVVTKLTPDSLAAAAGVLVGDRLVSVNGVPIDNFETGGRRLQQAAGKVELCVERGGQARLGCVHLRVSLRRVQLQVAKDLRIDGRDALKVGAHEYVDLTKVEGAHGGGRLGEAQ